MEVVVSRREMPQIETCLQLADSVVDLTMDYGRRGGDGDGDDRGEDNDIFSTAGGSHILLASLLPMPSTSLCQDSELTLSMISLAPSV